jgi:hypothetical protein
MNTEEWRPIPDTAGFYASNHGRVRRPNGKIAVQSKNPKGYCQTTDGTRTRGAHRMVALAWVPNPTNLPQVNHINGIKTDNRPENLEWVTGSNNMLHAYRTGLTVAHPTKGAACNFAKLTEEKVRAIHRAVTVEGMTHKTAGQKHGVGRSLVGLIINGKRWQHLQLV